MQLSVPWQLAECVLRQNKSAVLWALGFKNKYGIQT